MEPVTLWVLEFRTIMLFIPLWKPTDGRRFRVDKRRHFRL